MAKVLDPAITTELSGSPQFEQSASGSTIRRRFHVKVFDPLDAPSYLPDYGEAYQTDAGTVRSETVDSIRVEPLIPDSGNPLCSAEVTYTYAKDGGSSSDASERDSWTMDLVAASGHITHVRKASDQKVWPGGRSDGNTAIGDHDDKIDGVDIAIRSGVVSVTKFFEPEAVTEELVRLWYESETYTNDAPYTVGKLRAMAGELRFDGAAIARTGGTTRIKVDFKFIFEANAKPKIETLQGTVEPDKPGHDYLWTKPGRLTSAAPVGGGVIKTGTASVYVATVYGSMNFMDLKAHGLRL